MAWAPPSTWITEAVVARNRGDSRATAVSATAEESCTSQPSGARSAQVSSKSEKPGIDLAAIVRTGPDDHDWNVQHQNKDGEWVVVFGLKYQRKPA